MTENKLMRRLPLEGAINVRDLGGYAINDAITEQGETKTKWKSLLRADSLHQLTPQDQAYLLDYGLRTIIDLRGEQEIGQAPNVFAEAEQVRYVNIPMFAGEAVQNLPEQFTLLDTYKLMVDKLQPTIKTILTTIAEADEGVVMFHCSAGKDRTGITAALLLGLAGVAEADIVADYALTDQYSEPIKDRLRAFMRQRGGMTEAMIEDMLGSPASNMEQLLAHLKATYTDSESYLQHIGLSAAQIAALRSRLV